VIEAQLAHSVRDSPGRAYNRTEFVEQRRKMLQAWADYLTGCVAVRRWFTSGGGNPELQAEFGLIARGARWSGQVTPGTAYNLAGRIARSDRFHREIGCRTILTWSAHHQALRRCISSSP
jgi:hypothetical protein